MTIGIVIHASQGGINPPLLCISVVCVVSTEPEKEVVAVEMGHMHKSKPT